MAINLVITISEIPTRSPGTIPAANNPPTDTFITKAYRIMMPEGGMIGPITEETAVIAAENRVEYPFFPSLELTWNRLPMCPQQLIQKGLRTKCWREC